MFFDFFESLCSPAERDFHYAPYTLIALAMFALTHYQSKHKKRGIFTDAPFGVNFLKLFKIPLRLLLLY